MKSVSLPPLAEPLTKETLKSLLDEAPTKRWVPPPDLDITVRGNRDAANLVRTPKYTTTQNLFSYMNDGVCLVPVKDSDDPNGPVHLCLTGLIRTNVAFGAHISDAHKVCD